MCEVIERIYHVSIECVSESILQDTFAGVDIELTSFDGDVLGAVVGLAEGD